MLSPNKFEQLKVEDDVQETANVEEYGDNHIYNPTRTTTKESCVSEADLNDFDRPSTIANNQNYLITRKIPTTVVRPENQDIYIKERKLYLEDKLTVNRSEKQVTI